MKTLLSFLIPLFLCAGTVTAVNYASAEGSANPTITLVADEHVDATAAPVLLAQADTGSAALDAGAPTADTTQPASPSATPSPTTAPSAPVELQASDVGLVTKLYKNGAFFGLGIMALFLGLTIWSKVDKKHAFYAATLLGGVGLLVESIRRGDTPNAMMLYSTLTPTIGILIAGPNHVKATAS